MFDRFLDAMASFITRRRGPILGVLAVFVVVCAAGLPRLQADSSPENLLVSFQGYAARVQALHEAFGDHDSVVAILVEADDVTQRVPLGYVHQVATAFRDDPRVVRVEGLTTTPMPGARPSPSADTLDTLDTLDDEGPGPAPVEPAIEAALETLVASAPDLFPMGLYSIAERVGDGSADLHGVVRGAEVTDADAETIRAGLDDSPLLLGRLVSRDRRLAAVVLFLDPALGTGPLRLDAVHAIDAWLAAHPPPPGVEVYPAGLPHLRAAISDAVIADQIFLVPLSLLVCMVLLLLSFRWLPGTLLPLATVGLTVLCVLGIMGWVGAPLDVLMSTLPTLLIIMGISEAVHVVGRYVEESRRTTDRVEASRRTLRQLAIACFLTSFTTAIGFGSLLVAQTEMLRRFGTVAGLGVMLSYLLLMLFVPTAVTFLPAPRSGRGGVDEAPKSGRLEGWLLRGTAWLLRRPWKVLLVTVVLTVPCVWAWSSVRVDTALLDTFDADDPIVASTRRIERHLDGIRPLEILLEAEEGRDVRDPEVLAALDRLVVWAAAQPGVLRTTAPGDVLWEVWRRLAGLGVDAPHAPFASRPQIDALITLLHRLSPSPIDDFITTDGRHARAELRLGDIGAQRSIALIESIEQRAEQELRGRGVRVTFLGEAYIGSHGVDAVVADMFGSLSLSAVVIFLIIGLLFRSPRLGVLAIPPNVIPQVGTVAWMVVRGIPLNLSTAIVFSVAIGVSVDLTIHGFARLVEEEGRGMRRRAAILRSARSTGRAIVVSCATLVLGFSVMLLSGFVPVRHFGELIAAALTLSLVSTLVFQPALLMLFGGPPRGRKGRAGPA